MGFRDHQTYNVFRQVGLLLEDLVSLKLFYK